MGRVDMSRLDRNQNNTTTNQHAAIQGRIHASHTITKDDVVQLYHINKNLCQGCRANSKDNPNCFCCLVPPPNGNRKQGLWQKVADTVTELGPDPGEGLRLSQDSPSGLTNLGATGYINSVLQCLYMTRAFRTGVFAAEMELVRSHPVIYQLGLLFAQLHSGKRIAVDSAPFASTLELDNAVQQDGQEFMKLLLSLLERLLGMSQNMRARNVVQNVFRGTYSYVIRCSTCGQYSALSKRPVDFYELELNVKGFTSLEESLNDYLSEEILTGENQWMCESCQVRVDATHCTKLRSLPPVLNFQLKRFVFNMKTSTKKKVTSKFSFPRTIDMGPRLSTSGEAGRRAVYDLYRILIHKGSMANSGHYVAHIKDDRTEEWWQFDDEQVTSLGSHPLGEVSAQATPSKDAAQEDVGVKEQPSQGGSGEASSSAADPSSSRPQPETEMLTSADAYMLMYICRDEADNYKPECLAVDDPVPMEVERERDSSDLPEQLRLEIEQMNNDFEGMCWEYTRRRDEELARIAERKEEVRSILSQVPAKSLEEPFYWISTEWLRSWADSFTPPGPIDNRALLCPHQKVAPKSLPAMKRISAIAWMQLEALYNGGPVISGEDYCSDCIFEDAESHIACRRRVTFAWGLIELLHSVLIYPPHATLEGPPPDSYPDCREYASDVLCSLIKENGDFIHLFVGAFFDVFLDLVENEPSNILLSNLEMILVSFLSTRSGIAFITSLSVSQQLRLGLIYFRGFSRESHDKLIAENFPATPAQVDPPRLVSHATFSDADLAISVPSGEADEAMVPASGNLETLDNRVESERPSKQRKLIEKHEEVEEDED
ncbi:hypothetical protein KC19_5G182300 [Ceratodon purpureus]|uniref:Ubiquitin carboxyl-terminal hydrolase 26 n=3 Tax=Ceratodon purpureus TaxID=3225 RepID=A0A8T0I2W8_CERPU|nr:hypothetical protein KC19_5G182300 [Ceratodon purpureus]